MDNKDLILDQFTRQAVPFSTAPGITDDEALRRLVEATGAGPEDTVLDVACGSGLVVCAFARVVRHATGIDLTPAMLDRARALATEGNLGNVDWHLGDVLPLPWPDATFSIVTSRFAFHHFPEPAAVLAEMRRVCRPGGTVAVADLTASPDPGKARALDHVLRLIDPSHVRTLTKAELERLFDTAGLGVPQTTSYRLKADLDAVLARSFPNPGDEVEVRRLFAASVADDGLGLDTRRAGDALRFAYPVVIVPGPSHAWEPRGRKPLAPGRAISLMRSPTSAAAGPGGATPEPSRLPHGCVPRQASPELTARQVRAVPTRSTAVPWVMVTVSGPEKGPPITRRPSVTRQR